MTYKEVEDCTSPPFNNNHPQKMIQLHILEKTLNVIYMFQIILFYYKANEYNV